MEVHFPVASSRNDLRGWYAPLDPFLDPQHGSVDCRERCGPIFDRQIGQVDVHGEARHLAHEHVDRGAAFERESPVLRDRWEDANKQGDLLPICVQEGHELHGPPRSGGTVML